MNWNHTSLVDENVGRLHRCAARGDVGEILNALEGLNAITLETKII